MKFFSLVSILGINSCKSQEVNNIQHGNFSIQRLIQTEKGGGSVLNKSYDTRSYLIEYKVLHKAKLVRYPKALQSGTKYNFPWRVFILQDSRVPALVAGSQNMFLITEENDELKISELSSQKRKFGTIQWLDINDGHPGDEIQIHDPQNDNRIDSSLVLRGGKHLLINRFTILDVSSLSHHRFNKNNIYEHDGWKLALDPAVGYETAVGFSQKFKQVVFRAIKLDQQREGKYFSSLISFNYVNDSIQIVPFNRSHLRVNSLDEVNSNFVAKFFEWDGNGNIELRKDVQPPSWQGKLNFVDQYFINYELYPVSESMTGIFLDYLKNKSPGKESPTNKISIIDETDKQSSLLKFKLEIGGKLFQLTYDKNDLKLIFDRHFSDTHSEAHREMIVSIGNDFNSQLSQNRYQEHFTKYKGE
jgi:hypothetical protein